MTYSVLTQHFETIRDFLRFGFSEAEAKALYFGHGTDNAWDDVLELVMGSLHLPSDVDETLWQARLTPDEKKRLCCQLEKRIQERIPVPYLTQRAYFCDLEFYVDERVLIPRSPIAELIQSQFSPWIDPSRVTSVLDLCTGSGCIAIACSEVFPEAKVDAVDISSDALAVAAINRERYELMAQVTLIQSDCFDSVPVHQYDLIVSNPPYVSREEMMTLPAEYHHEPVLALETTNQGLAIVEKILQTAHDYLTAHGILVVEVGNSADALIEAFPDLPFTWLDFEHGGDGVFILTRDQLV